MILTNYWAIIIKYYYYWANSIAFSNEGNP